MNFSERLIGTSLEGDKDAKAICGILDWLAKQRVVKQPSHRDWSMMLGLGSTGSSRARKVLILLEKEGIIERQTGTGCKTDSLVIPEHGNTPSDWRADFERRKQIFKKRVIEELRIYVKNNVWDDVEGFFNHWSEDVGVKDENGIGEYLMLFEKEERLLKDKGRTFTLRSRFVGWVKNKEKRGLACPVSAVERKSNEQIEAEAEAHRREQQKSHIEGLDYLKRKQEFLDGGGTMEEWLNQERQ